MRGREEELSSILLARIKAFFAAGQRNVVRLTSRPLADLEQERSLQSA
jgi:hypothetical protein